VEFIFVHLLNFLQHFFPSLLFYCLPNLLYLS
jgi:hypothetical protein